MFNDVWYQETWRVIIAQKSLNSLQGLVSLFNNAVDSFLWRFIVLLLPDI